MKLGIVGLPNVGKSTLFNSLTKAGAESANYPFCTIDPNVGVVTVPDERLNLLGDFYKSKKVTPAVIEFVDIAGLVKGASKGEGLGNQFLANIREVDAIVHVVRCFEDSNVVHEALIRSAISRLLIWSLFSLILRSSREELPRLPRLHVWIRKLPKSLHSLKK